MKVLYFDTETTGLSPTGGIVYGNHYLGGICQLSYILESDDGRLVGKNFYFTVDYVEYGAYKIHGLSTSLLRELSGGREFSDDYKEIDSDFKWADVIVAHNFSFDNKFMSAEFSRINRTFEYARSFCTMRDTRDHVKILSPKTNKVKLPSLAELADYFGVDEEEVQAMSKRLFNDNSVAHDARYDTCKLALLCIKGRQVCPSMMLALTDGYLE